MTKLDNYVYLFDYNIVDDFDIIDKDLRNVMGVLTGYEYDSDSSVVPIKISKFSMWNSSKKFMEERFTLHKVGYLNNNKLARSLNNSKISSIEDIADIFNESIQKRYPYYLPINFSHDSVFGGSLVGQAVMEDLGEEAEKLFSLLDICFSKITLPRKVTRIASISYSHEITHSQISSHKGSCENFYNTEALPIFVELLHGYYEGEDVLNVDLMNRITNTLGHFFSLYIYKNGDKSKLDDGYDQFHFHLDAQYVQSALIAFNLLVKTLYGTAFTKETIFRQMQKVFDGKITVEQFLSSVGATYEESKDSSYIEKIMKKIK